MENFALFVKEYWFLIILAIAVISTIAIKVYTWFKQPTSDQLKNVKEWLLYAVAKAERELGSGTGQLKLRYVYNMFVEKFPAIAIFITFEDFSKMADEALDKFNELLKENTAINDYYEIVREDEIGKGEG